MQSFREYWQAIGEMSNFDKPAFDFNSFVEGVKYHDIGYGENDNSPLE